MKASAEKSTSSSSATASRVVSQPFFSKAASEGHFFAPQMPTAAPAVQARLNTGQQSDQHEREADMMAERVVRPTEKTWKQCCPPEEEGKIQLKPLAESVTPFVPRQVATEKFPRQAKNSAEETLPQPGSAPRWDDEEEPVQKREEREEPAQAKSLGGGPVQILPAIEKSLRANRGLGNPLPDTFLQTMEKGFGADFSRVRLHTGSQAADLSKNFQSQAFTVRNDIYFAQGKYNPATTEGKLLLAHELTHTIQQGASKTLPVTTGESWAQPAIDLADDMRARRTERLQKSARQEKTALPPATARPPVASAAVYPGKDKMSEGKEVAAPAILVKTDVPTPSETTPKDAATSKGPASFQENPDFHETTKQVRTEAKKQKKTHPTAGKKREEAEKASALGEKEQIDQSAREKNIAVMEGQAEKQNLQRFSADEFKENFYKLVEKQKKPKTESEVKGFAQKPPIEGFPKDISDGLAKKQGEVTRPLQEKATLDPTGGVVEKPIKGIPEPTYPPAPKPVDPKLAIPKPKTDAERSLQSESNRLDSAMQKNRLSEEQLAESREPSFLETLKLKQEAQKKIAEAPGNYRQREDEILKRAEGDINTSLSTKLAGMSKIHHKMGGKILGSQKDTQSKTKNRQGEIKEDIDNIYNKTVVDVTNILKGMAEKVKEDFTNSLENQKRNFNENITSSLESYYTTGKKIKHFFLGEPKVVVNEDGSTRPLTPEDYDPYPFNLKSGVEWINPDVYKVFLKEKDKFIATMDGELENIANNVELGLTMAHLRIQLGQTTIAIYKAGLKGEERVFAETLEQEVKMKFETLEGSIDDTRDELLQTLADQYNENLNDLETKFKEINDELKKTWVDRAIDFIETVGKTIYQLADLLLSILFRIAAIVWDIIKHPIRFFETLVKGLIKGIGTFLDDLGTYLEEAFWSWITGATSAKGIRLGPGSAVEKLFGLVVQVVGISKEDLQKLAEKIFQMDVVAFVEKGVAMGETLMAEGQKLLAPAVILLRDGLGAFWNYLKDTVGGMVKGVFAKIKETVFFEFVKKGLKWIAGFFVPGGGFVKVVKALFAAVEFLVNNMDKIRAIFDSILGSFEKAVRQDDSGVAAKVLTGLKTGVVLALDFLARQLGLDTIIGKVQKFFHDLRKPILQVIEWVMRQIRSGLEKIGFFQWLNTLKKAGAKVLQAGLPKDPNERLRLGMQKALSALNRFAGKKVGKVVLNPLLAGIKIRYGFQVLEPFPRGDKWWVRGTVNPTEEKEGQSIPDKGPIEIPENLKIGIYIKFRDQIWKISSISSKYIVVSHATNIKDTIKFVTNIFVENFKNGKFPSPTEKEIKDLESIDPEWQNKRIGHPQKTGTKGHAELMDAEAIKYQKMPSVKFVYLDRQYRTIKIFAENKIKSERRADIVVEHKSGRIDIIEIRSKSDDEAELLARNYEVLLQLPDKKTRGGVVVKKIPGINYPI